MRGLTSCLLNDAYRFASYFGVIYLAI